MVYTMPTYIIHIGFVLIIVALNVWLSLFLKQRRKKPIKEHPVLNNPDLFPLLNETTLKKHIKKKITNTPLNEIIHKISLYESNVPGHKYQLIVEAPAYHKGFSNITQNWDVENPLEDNFSDIYRKKPKANYKKEWRGSVADLEPQLQDAFVVKSANWILYKK